MTTKTNADNTISCAICGSHQHHIGKHLQTTADCRSALGMDDLDHLSVDDHIAACVEAYTAKFPDEPTTSPTFDRAQQEIARRKQESKDAQAGAIAQTLEKHGEFVKMAMHEVFQVPLDEHTRTTPVKGARNGNPIMIDVMTDHDQAAAEAIPDVDPDYHFDGASLKDACMGLALRDNIYAFGMHGTGKTSFFEQIAARLRRPLIRVQHTDTTEEAHIIGSMAVRNGATEWDHGPLAEAMINGWIYLGDEYDVAHPGVLAVYQPVLEGKPLYIKEAPPSMRLVKPHPNFRFWATGNTNGSGDDTGLYSGTKIGNAANYSRFGTTIRIDFPPADREESILIKRLQLDAKEAKQAVDFANRVRGMYDKGEVSLPISPRELIGACRKAVVTGGKFRHGLDLNFINRLGKIEAAAVRECAQRVFGGV